MNEVAPTRRLRLPRILIVGCGDVGVRLARLLMPRFAVTGTTTTRAGADALRAQGIQPYLLDLDRACVGIPSAPWVVHLAPPSTSGSHDLRTRRLLQALPTPARLVYVSTSAVYGDCGGADIDETRKPAPQSARGQRRLDAEDALRRYARTRAVHLSILRVPGIYAGDRLPLERLKAHTPALRQEEDVYTNHIHADDLARILRSALLQGRPLRVYHASDQSRLKMGDYFDLVAKAHQLPQPPRLAKDELAKHLSPAQLSFMRESRLLDTRRLREELGVALAYPTVAAYLKANSGDSLQ